VKDTRLFQGVQLFSSRDPGAGSSSLEIERVATQES